MHCPGLLDLQFVYMNIFLYFSASFRNIHVATTNYAKSKATLDDGSKNIVLVEGARTPFLMSGTQ